MKKIWNRRRFIRGLVLLAAGKTLEGWTAALGASRPPSSSKLRTSETRNLMGTFVTITLFHSPLDQARELLEASFRRMEALIRVFDRHDPRSALSVLNEGGSLSGPPPELTGLMNRCRSLHALTGGRFEVTIKPVLDLYENGKARGRLPSDHERGEALARVGLEALEIHPRRIAFAREGMGITLDGIAKGTIVDDAVAFLRGKGVRHALVDAGGDLRVTGGRGDGGPWHILVYNPVGGTGTGESIFLREGAVATSGNYMVYFDRERVHHHILSPQNGISPGGFIGSTVIHPSAETADALATTLMLFSPREGLSFIDRQGKTAALILNRDGGKKVSRQWPRNIRTTGGETSHG